MRPPGREGGGWAWINGRESDLSYSAGGIWLLPSQRHCAVPCPCSPATSQPSAPSTEVCRCVQVGGRAIEMGSAAASVSQTFPPLSVPCLPCVPSCSAFLLSSAELPEVINTPTVRTSLSALLLQAPPFQGFSDSLVSAPWWRSSSHYSR